MTRKSIAIAALAVMILQGGVSSCVKRVEKSAKAVEREEWRVSLKDSIKSVEKEISDIEGQLEFLHEKIGTLLTAFTHVSNPREVEGYTILSGWQGRYPLKSTGIVARITEDEGFEIIAALSKGTFDAIAAESGESYVESVVVPHDQALNYRLPGLNTVAFTAGRADSIGSFIASAPGDVTIIYLSGGRRAGSLHLPAATKQMLADTWELYSSQHQAEQLERKIPMLSGKLQAIRRMADGNEASARSDRNTNTTNQNTK